MGAGVTSPILRWFVFAAVVILSVGLALTGVRHGIAEYWTGSSDPDQWLRAAELEPSNPDNWYHLGRYRFLDSGNGDLRLAISYYKRAVAIDPGSALYWSELAQSYESIGDLRSAEQAHLRAQQDYPISAEVAWEYGNFLLRQNRVPEAFRQIQRALSADPKLTTLALSRCWRSTQDIDQILKFALPANADVYWGALDFFIGSREPVPAMAVWKQLASNRPSFPLPKAFPLLDLLLESNDADDAQIVWRQAISSTAIMAQPASTGTLIWDGGFEQNLLNGGFAWRYQPVEGADIELDEETVHSGRRSLRVDFDGTANVDFKNIWQYVAVEPNTRYRFGAYIRAQELSTDSGIRFEIDQNGILPLLTPNIIGTQPWTLNDIEFSTGPETRVLRVVLRRTPSDRFGNKIRGTAWVDDISLTPMSRRDPVLR